MMMDRAINQTRRARRKARREKRSKLASPLLALPFSQPKSPLKPLEFCNADQIEELHEASIRILEDTGICFLDTEALKIWHQAGARVDYEKQKVFMEGTA